MVGVSLDQDPREFRLGSLRISPPLILAPLADYTHAAFRTLVADYGGVGLFYTEMLNSRILAFGSAARDPYLLPGRGDRPLVAQVVGGDPDVVFRAVARLVSLGHFSAIDINMACTRGAIQRFGWGVSLMKDSFRAREILRAARDAAAGLPLTVKIRSGWEHDLPELLRFVRLLEEEGASAIVLHPRSAREGFRRRARWEEIRAVVREVSIPVIGSGDVFSPEDARRMFLETGCAGVMIGRAALLRPWIFRDTEALLRNELPPGPPDPFSPLARLADLMEEFLPEDMAFKRFRLYCFWYLQNFPFGFHYLKLIQKETDLNSMLKCLQGVLAGERFPAYPARPVMIR